MNKRVVLAIIICVVIVAAVVIGVLCGNQKENTTEVTKSKVIEIIDENLGYKTTFTYPDNEDYKVTDVDNDSGRSVTVVFESETQNLEVETYYSMNSKYLYDSQKADRSDKKYYQAYTFNGYDAYFYSEYDNSAYLIIMLDEDAGESLFMSLEKADYTKDGTVFDIVNTESVQNFLNSITFEKTK